MAASNKPPAGLPLLKSNNPRENQRPGSSPLEDAKTAVNSRCQSFEIDTEKNSTNSTPSNIDIYGPNRPKLGFRERIHHFTWAWFTWPMSTGGLSLLIYTQPYQFPGLRQIGFAVYITNLIIFTTLLGLMITRFCLHRGDFIKSVTHPREGLFLPTFFLAIATIITSTERYVVPENDVALRWLILAAFWTYLLVTLILAVGQYSFLFARHKFELQSMMPTWILPIFPIMLSGTIASVISDSQPDIAAIPIIVAGLTAQGLGISVAVMMYAHMIGRLMLAELPNREHRPGLFMNVGPPAFTALAFIGMANGLPDSFDRENDGIIDANIIRTFALIAAIFLWALSLWWFFIAAIAVISSPPKYFHLGWWAMVFPNTGFILATISIAKEFRNPHVLRAGSALSILLVLMYFFVLVSHIRAVVKQEIMYPGRDEDVEDH
ncbi:putative C4-dicarboxylate transport protein mae1 [Rosellinia necatrix]|uniref:Putative C4-dicarboxylate transport protein mae1 n=1 Tax=Rosellinia necatrix TaxID=77044 RepID=A0A1S7UIW9_ROSNE|nr:putative C4-dicarboxylate transport protein mae1 [Rosellinia necatrix]